MTTISHEAYVAEQDEEQLRHLIETAKARLDELTQGGWVWLWVVADNANQGWFADSDYASAVALFIAKGAREELSIERRQYRSFEAERLVSFTKEEQAGRS